MAKFVEKFDLWKKQRADKRKQMEQDRRIQDFLSLAKSRGNVSAFLEKISLSEHEKWINKKSGKNPEFFTLLRLSFHFKFNLFC